MKEFFLNPLHYVTLPGYSFDCWFMPSGDELERLQDKQLLDDFVEAKRGGICGIMGDRYETHSNMSIWYTDANDLYGYAMMQKLPCKDFEYQRTCFVDYDTSLDNGDSMLHHILKTPDDSDHGYYIVCEINYTNSGKDRTEKTALMPNKKINDNELGYKEREKGRARTEKLNSDQKQQNRIYGLL